MNITELYERLYSKSLKENPTQNLPCYDLAQSFDTHYFRLTSHGQYELLKGLFSDLELRIRFAKKQIGTEFSQNMQKSANKTLHTFEEYGDIFILDKNHLVLAFSHPEYSGKLDEIQTRLLMCEQKRDEIHSIFRLNHILDSFDGISFTQAKTIYAFEVAIQQEKFETAHRLQKSLKQFYRNSTI